MLSFINAFNLSLFILFTVLYSYQIFYAFVALFHKVRPTPPASRNHRGSPCPVFIDAAPAFSNMSIS